MSITAFLPEEENLGFKLNILHGEDRDVAE